MQFAGKLTEADLNDVGKMTRSKIYLLKLVIANLGSGPTTRIGTEWPS